MTYFETHLTAIFEQRAEVRIVDADEERELIRAAALGDEAATVALLYAYAPALRNAVGRYRHSLTPAVWNGSAPAATADEVDELRQVVVVGFLEAVAAFDPERHERLAAIVAEYLTDAAATAMAGALALSVPDRMVKRYFGICRRAHGDLEAAERMAPDFEMSRETFRRIGAVVDAARFGELQAPEAASEDDDEPDSPITGAVLVGRVRSELGDDFLSVANRMMADAALKVIEDDELKTRVVRLRYGFDAVPILASGGRVRDTSDEDVAVELGLSRLKVLRTRTAALVEMREALAVDAEDVP